MRDMRKGGLLLVGLLALAMLAAACGSGSGPTTGLGPGNGHPVPPGDSNGTGGNLDAFEKTGWIKGTIDGVPFELTTFVPKDRENLLTNDADFATWSKDGSHTMVEFMGFGGSPFNREGAIEIDFTLDDRDELLVWNDGVQFSVYWSGRGLTEDFVSEPQVTARWSADGETLDVEGSFQGYLVTKLGPAAEPVLIEAEFDLWTVPGRLEMEKDK